MTVTHMTFLLCKWLLQIMLISYFDHLNVIHVKEASVIYAKGPLLEVYMVVFTSIFFLTESSVIGPRTTHGQTRTADHRCRRA